MLIYLNMNINQYNHYKMDYRCYKRIQDKNRYLVKLNNKCVALDNIGGYDLEDCNENSENQYFNITNISNDSNYKNELEEGMLINMNVNPNGDLNYPFSLIKSEQHNNCLQNNSNNISVVPCQAKNHRDGNLIKK